MATAFGLTARAIHIPFGKPVTASAIQQHLEKYPKTKAILIQACDTSTATLHPIQEISQITRSYPNLLLIVDAISALIAVDLDMDQWGIDILIGGSQKSFALPTGLSFLALSQKAKKLQSQSQLPIFYFDLEKEQQANQKGQTAFSSNVTFIRALHAQLKKYIEIGLNQIQKRHLSLAQATWKFAKILKLPLFSEAPSPSVTAICIPDGIDGVKIKKWMEEHGVIIGGGQGHLVGKIVRLGHLGEISTTAYLQGLRVFGQALIQQCPEVYNETLINQALSEATRFLNTP